MITGHLCALPVFVTPKLWEICRGIIDHRTLPSLNLINSHQPPGGVHHFQNEHHAASQDGACQLSPRSNSVFNQHSCLCPSQALDSRQQVREQPLKAAFWPCMLLLVGWLTNNTVKSSKRADDRSNQIGHAASTAAKRFYASSTMIMTATYHLLAPKACQDERDTTKVVRIRKGSTQQRFSVDP